MAPVLYHAGKFPPEDIDWARLVPLIGPASAALARYDGLLLAIPNASVLLSPLTTQEAVLSSRIEGTQATMGEVLQFEAGAEISPADPEKMADIQEVLNYRRAMREAVEGMAKLPICGRLIRHAHATLLAGVRGTNKGRGRYRTIQNYIGTMGRPIDEARYVPVAPDQVQEGHREDYYDRLLAVSCDDGWTGWCEFFLAALTRQAEANHAKAVAILGLYQRKKDWIAELTHSQYAIRALDWFFGQPIFKTPDFMAAAGIPKPTAIRIVRLGENTACCAN